MLANYFKEFTLFYYIFQRLKWRHIILRTFGLTFSAERKSNQQG